MKYLLILEFLFSAFIPIGFAQPAAKPSSIGRVVANFSLRNIDEKTVSLDDYPNAKGFVVVFTCNHCPFAKLYSKRLNKLNAKYKSLGVPVLAINSMDTSVYDEEGFSEMQKRATGDRFTFPYLSDATQTVGKDFGADHTPQAYVIWKENNYWVIKYSGAIDDNGQHPEKATAFVANAINDLLAAKPVRVAEAESIGCAIYYRETVLQGTR